MLATVYTTRTLQILFDLEMYIVNGSTTSHGEVLALIYILYKQIPWELEFQVRLLLVF
jgi:hypothetical protein